MCLCCRSSGLSRISSAVKNRLVSSKKRWDHQVYVNDVEDISHVQSHRSCWFCCISADDWRGGLPAADTDRHCEDHEHQAWTRPQNLQRHPHVQEHRRGTQVIPPSLTGGDAPPIIMCQNHSVAGTKRPWPLFHVFGVLYPSERGRAGRVGGDKGEVGRRREKRKYRYFWGINGGRFIEGSWWRWVKGVWWFFTADVFGSVSEFDRNHTSARLSCVWSKLWQITYPTTCFYTEFIKVPSGNSRNLGKEVTFLHSCDVKYR